MLPHRRRVRLHVDLEGAIIVVDQVGVGALDGGSADGVGHELAIG